MKKVKSTIKFSVNEEDKLNTTNGWVMVPLEPTEEMYKAGIDACYDDGNEGLKDVYRAMIRVIIRTM